MRIAADLLTVVVCVVLLAFFAREYGRPASPPSPTVQDVHIDGAVADFGRTSKTIILALKTDCVFCQRSAPFYRRLVERIERDGPDAQVVVAAHSNDRGIDDFLVSEGINPDSVVFVASGELPVRGTPTLLLVDGEGLVTHIWIGLLDADREAEVFDALFG